MKRFAVGGKNTLGVSIPVLRKMAKDINKEYKSDSDTKHKLALELFDSGIHEARILAGMIDEPNLVTEKQMDNWTSKFDSWDVVDQVCMNLFDKTKFAYDKVYEYTNRKPEFEKRTAFTLIACLAWHDRQSGDERFSAFFPLIKQGATDRRNYVKKAVNWALRHIGKRNMSLREEALKTAEEIQKIDDKTARWIAGDAIRELNNPKIIKRIKN